MFGPTVNEYVPGVDWVEKLMSNCLLPDPATAVTLFTLRETLLGPTKLVMSAVVKVAESIASLNVTRTLETGLAPEALGAAETIRGPVVSTLPALTAL